MKQALSADRPLAEGLRRVYASALSLYFSAMPGRAAAS